jgi:hypothetical protein
MFMPMLSLAVTQANCRDSKTAIPDINDVEKAFANPLTGARAAVDHGAELKREGNVILII